MYKVNLLPTELQRDISIDFRKLVKRLSVSLLAITLLASYSAFLYSFYSNRKDIARTERYLNELRVTVTKVEDIKKQRQNNEQSVQTLRELLSKRLSWSPLLEDLNCNLPVDMWLESFDLSFTDLQTSTGAAGQSPGQPKALAPQAQAQSKPAQTGNGASSDGQAPAAGQKGPLPPASLTVPNTLTLEGYSRTVPSIGIFVNNLNRMPYFNRVTLNEISEDKKYGAIRFKVTAMLKESGR